MILQTYTPNGLSTTNTSRKEGKETEGQKEHLQQQAHTDAGSQTKKRDRIIYIENSANIDKPFVIQDVGCVKEVMEKICALHPALSLDCIGLRISNMRCGSRDRKYYSDKIPYDTETLYVSMYLLKHPPISYK